MNCCSSFWSWLGCGSRKDLSGYQPIVDTGTGTVVVIKDSQKGKVTQVASESIGVITHGRTEYPESERVPLIIPRRNKITSSSSPSTRNPSPTRTPQPSSFTPKFESRIIPTESQVDLISLARGESTGSLDLEELVLTSKNYQDLNKRFSQAVSDYSTLEKEFDAFKTESERRRIEQSKESERQLEQVRAEKEALEKQMQQSKTARRLSVTPTTDDSAYQALQATIGNHETTIEALRNQIRELIEKIQKIQSEYEFELSLTAPKKDLNEAQGEITKLRAKVIELEEGLEKLSQQHEELGESSRRDQEKLGKIKGLMRTIESSLETIEKREHSLDKIEGELAEFVFFDQHLPKKIEEYRTKIQESRVKEEVQERFIREQGESIEKLEKEKTTLEDQLKIAGAIIQDYVPEEVISTLATSDGPTGVTSPPQLTRGLSFPDLFKGKGPTSS